MSRGAASIPPAIQAKLGTPLLRYDQPGHSPERRRLSSLTSGLETRRKGISQSTLYAISSLFYGVLESRPIR